MKRVIILLLFIQIVSSYIDRNYYSEELIFYNKNFTFGNNGADLNTTWHQKIYENVSFGIYENNRLKYIKYNNEIIEIPVIDTDRYNQSYMASIVTSLDAEFTQRFGTSVTETFLNCIYERYNEIDMALRNEIENQHFRFPYAHITKNERGYCLDKP